MFDGVNDSVSAYFCPFHREVGGEGKKERKVRDRQEEYIQIVTYRSFFPFPVQPHLLFSFIMVRTKMPSVFRDLSVQYNQETTTDVTLKVILFHGFRSAAKRDLTLAVFDIINLCSAVLPQRSRKFYKFKCRPFQFHKLNSMVPEKG